MGLYSQELEYYYQIYSLLQAVPQPSGTSEGSTATTNKLWKAYGKDYFVNKVLNATGGFINPKFLTFNTTGVDWQKLNEKTGPVLLNALGESAAP